MRSLIRTPLLAALVLLAACGRDPIPAEPAGTTPLTLRTQAKPGEKIQVIANVPQLPAAGDLHCEIIADGTTAPLDAQTGDPKGMPMVQCDATVPEPTS